MSEPVDMLANTMADAPLTPEQREVWQTICAELMLSRIRIQELEKRIETIERVPDEGTSSTLLNRPDFNREVARMLAFDERYGGTSSVIYISIENLDMVKTRYGESMAHSALRLIADTLANNVRRSDIVGRLAYDEFGIMLPHCSKLNAMRKGQEAATRIHDALVKVWGMGVKPVISYGAYTFNEKEALATGLKQAAATLTRLFKES